MINKSNHSILSTFPWAKDMPHILIYGSSIALLVFVFKRLQWKFLIVGNAIEIYIGLIAVLFAALGIWVATQLVKPKLKTVIIEKEVIIQPPTMFTINEDESGNLDLTSREYVILQRLSKGMNNAEIAESLFLFIPTIKTHVSNLYSKMDVKSRTHNFNK